jgi:hypothetical protein
LKPVARPIKVSAMLRVALHVVIGTVAGFALGILAPIALYAFMSWKDPVGIQQGGGTVFPFLMLLTAPIGAIYGAAWGYQRANPPKTIIKLGPERVLADFEEQFGGRPLEEQRIALAAIAPVWMAEYRRWVNVRLAIIALFSVVFLRDSGGFLFWLMVCGGYAVQTVRTVARVRSAVQEARDRWGADLVDGLNLHWTLRVLGRP